MHGRRAGVWLVVCGWFLAYGLIAARCAERSPLSPADLAKLESWRQVAWSPGGERAAVIRRWVDDSLTERFALGLTEPGKTDVRLIEPGSPDARSVTWSPDGRWLAIRSTRPHPTGGQPLPSVPPQSDAPTDVWLVRLSDERIFPLSAQQRPYGRVFNDPFYGRVQFSPDGRQLVFIADDGRDPRTLDERTANVVVVRPDQGEGYTGYGPAQVWVARLDLESQESPVRDVRRLTNDDVWYGDPQWSPDSTQLVVHANKSALVESVRFSINQNYDLWSIEAGSGLQRQLTIGPGADVSPRWSPDGKRLLCLSSPRRGPHTDLFNVLLLEWATTPGPLPARVAVEYHADQPGLSPPGNPLFPLPDETWLDTGRASYSVALGVETIQVVIDLSSASTTPRPASNTAAARPGLTPALNGWLAERFAPREEIVHWNREGVELEGIITRPPQELASRPYPLIVYPHGGPHSRSTRGNVTAQWLASAGYLVFQPNFRGSLGYGRRFLDADRFDLGGEDHRDVLAGIEHLIAAGEADRERQFVYGSSYGGFMTSWLVGQTGQFRAAVAQNAVTDMQMMWSLGDLQSWTTWELGGLPWEVPQRMHDHSPLSHVERVATPTLILHAQQDRRCPVAMGRAFHQSLLTRGVPTGLIEYPDEGHGIAQPRHQIDVLRRILAWFERHDPAQPIKIVTLGDSITKGERSGVEAGETFAAQLGQGLADVGRPLVVENVGRGGERTDQARARLETVIALKPRIVTIMYGTNDSYVDAGKEASRVSTTDYRDHLAEVIRRLREAGIEPILMTSPRWGARARLNGLGEHPNQRLESYVEVCRQVAADFRVPLVDHFSVWTQAESAGQNLSDWTTDECHPNPAGHRALADRLLPVLREVVTRHGMPSR